MNMNYGSFENIETIKSYMCPILAIMHINNKCEGTKCPMLREDYKIVNMKKVDYVYCGVGGKP